MCGAAAGFCRRDLRVSARAGSGWFGFVRVVSCARPGPSSSFGRGPQCSLGVHRPVCSPRLRSSCEAGFSVQPGLFRGSGSSLVAQVPMPQSARAWLEQGASFEATAAMWVSCRCRGVREMQGQAGRWSLSLRQPCTALLAPDPRFRGRLGGGEAFEDAAPPGLLDRQVRGDDRSEVLGGIDPRRAPRLIGF